MSSSYCPRSDDPAFGPLMDALGALFARFATDGTVAFAYRTQLYTGEASGLRRGEHHA